MHPLAFVPDPYVFVGQTMQAFPLSAFKYDPLGQTAIRNQENLFDWTLSKIEIIFLLTDY